MNYLAFDLGGSSGKLILARYERGKLSFERIHQFSNHPVDINGNLYWDIIRICDELYTGIRKAIVVTGDQIDCIAFDSFCNDFAFVSKTGELLAPVFCYRDSRTTRCQEHTYGVMSKEALYRINGNQMALFNTLLQLDALQTEGKSWMMDNSYKALFLSDLFIQLLTGKYVTEYTTASVTQMYDYAADDWSDEIFERFNIRKSLFAPIVKPGTLIGRTTEAFNRAVGTKGFQVAAVCQHDTGSAFLSSVETGNCAIISTGTWCLVGMETEKPVITQQGFEANVANEGGYADHHRLLRNVMGTWIIQEIVRELNENGQEISYEGLDRLAAKKPGGTVWFDVDHPAFYQPGHMIQKVKSACKTACGKEPDDLGEIIRCVYESLALKYRYTIEILEAMTGADLSVVNMIGGGSNSSLMCQITADVLQRPVTAGPADATSCGNVLVQMLAMGDVSSVEEGRERIRSCSDIRTYRPSGDQKWNEFYIKFKIRG